MAAMSTLGVGLSGYQHHVELGRCHSNSIFYFTHRQFSRTDTDGMDVVAVNCKNTSRFIVT